MTTEMLKKYIGNIYDLEVSMYNQNKLYTVISNEVDKLGKYDGEALYDQESKNPFSFYLGDGIGESISVLLGGAIIGTVIGGIIGGLLNVFHFAGLDDFWGGVIYGVIIGAVAGFIFFLFASIIEYLIDSHKVNSENREIALKNDELRQISTENKKIINRKIEILNQQLENISLSYYKTKDILDKYYDMNIIYPKYRNLIAISSFYEYFSSGRCSELEGHEGAYNIYETEMRLDRINDKLDDILDNLESIKQNQYALYSAIQDSNSKAEEIAFQVFKSAEYLQNIENNTAVISYNSEIATQNTEYLKWVNIFNG